MRIYYNPHINELRIPEETEGWDTVVLLGVGYYWFYIGDL